MKILDDATFEKSYKGDTELVLQSLVRFEK